MRPATREEADAVVAFFEGVHSGITDKVFAGMEPAIVERDGALLVCLASPESFQLPPELLDGAVAAGLPIGVLEDGVFRLDLQGALLMANFTSNQCVKVNEHAARLFLYSRDVLGDSVLSADPSVKPGDACIVTNVRGEGLGIGEVVGNFKGSKSAVRSVHDLGSYLRDQTQEEDED
jgi:NOL1/NOP2/fmu family ribosome biogenesis protein